MSAQAVLRHVCRHPVRLGVTLTLACGVVFALPVALAAAAAG